MNLFGEDRVKIAIERLKTFEPPEGYYLAFSGGKDSVVIKRLAEMAGVKFDAHYNVTTIDPPELVYYIKEHHKDVVWNRPEKPFLSMLVKNGFPSRKMRWCCELYKERGGSGRVVITGIRAKESTQRSRRKMVETCYTDPTKRFLHVIIDWSASEVWEFIKDEKLPYCKLYDEGWKRVGCLFCPYDSPSNRLEKSVLYPTYTKLFIKAFEKLYQDRMGKSPDHSFRRFRSGEELFYFWMTGKGKAEENQDNTFFYG